MDDFDREYEEWLLYRLEYTDLIHIDNDGHKDTVIVLHCTVIVLH